MEKKMKLPSVATFILLSLTFLSVPSGFAMTEGFDFPVGTQMQTKTGAIYTRVEDHQTVNSSVTYPSLLQQGWQAPSGLIWFAKPIASRPVGVDCVDENDKTIGLPTRKEFRELAADMGVGDAQGRTAVPDWFFENGGRSRKILFAVKPSFLDQVFGSSIFVLEWNYSTRNRAFFGETIYSDGATICVKR